MHHAVWDFLEFRLFSRDQAVIPCQIFRLQQCRRLLVHASSAIELPACNGLHRRESRFMRISISSKPAGAVNRAEALVFLAPPAVACVLFP
jgi:hypothetical protein